MIASYTEIYCRLESIQPGQDQKLKLNSASLIPKIGLQDGAIQQLAYNQTSVKLKQEQITCWGSKNSVMKHNQLKENPSLIYLRRKMNL